MGVGNEGGTTGVNTKPEEIFKDVLYTICGQKGTANAFYKSLDGDFSLFIIATEDDLRDIYTEKKFAISEKLKINKFYYYCQINDIKKIEELEGLTEEEFKNWPSDLNRQYQQFKAQGYSKNTTGTSTGATSVGASTEKLNQDKKKELRKV